ncbi:hypothetical protein COP1_036575 [Malus domestica]
MSVICYESFDNSGVSKAFDAIRRRVSMNEREGDENWERYQKSSQYLGQIHRTNQPGFRRGDSSGGDKFVTTCGVRLR